MTPKVLAEAKSLSLRDLAARLPGIVGGILCLTAIFGTWWTFSRLEADYYSANFGLFGYSSVTTSSGREFLYFGYYRPPSSVGGVMMETMVLAVGGLILGWGGAMLAFVRTRPASRASAFFAGAGGLLGIAGASYMMAALPGAVVSDFGPYTFVEGFWGWRNVVGTEVWWGAGYSWYAEVVGSALMLLGVLVVGLMDFLPSRRQMRGQNA